MDGGMKEYWIWKKDEPIAGPFPSWQSAKEFRKEHLCGGCSIAEHKPEVPLAPGPWHEKYSTRAAT